MSKPFFKQLHRQIKTSFLTIAVAFLGAILLSPAAPSSRAANLPDWLAAAAKQPIPPTIPKDAVAVILYSDQQTTVSPNGDVETRYREACKILRPEGKDQYGFVGIPFSKDTPLISLSAWSIPASGKIYELKQSDAAETGIAGGNFYDELKVEMLQIPAADPGNVIGYEYVQKGRPLIFAAHWDFQDRVPVLQAQYTLQIPSGWGYDSHWVNHPEVQPQTPSPNEYSWNLAKLPAISTEDGMPPWRSVAGRLDLKFFSSTNSYQSQQAGSWNQMGLWYSALADSRRDVTPDIAAQVAAVTAQAKTPLEKIQAIADYMQRHIRYVSIEIGIGGWQPHAADLVFKNQFGDCKDKATLLSAMLKAAGFDSYYAVAQVYRGIVQPNFASVWSFNHMILAIRLPDGVPTANLYSVIDDPKLGKLLFFDPTNPYVPLGYIPDYEQDNYVLLVAPDGGQLVHLPVLPPATNRLMRVGQFTLTSAGDLSGDVKEIRWGGPAAQSRAQFLEGAPKDREKIIDQFLGSTLDNFQLQSAGISNLNDFSDNFVLDYRFSAPAYAKQAGDLILLRPRVLGTKGSSVYSDPARKYPVEYPEATLQTDEFDFTLPAGYTVDELPPPAQVDCGYISYQSKTTLDGNVIRYTRTYQINKVMVPVSGLKDLRAALAAISNDERSAVVLKPSS
jgi:hypothetical protein